MLELSPAEIEALTLSLKVALCGTLVSLPIGIAVATLLARYDFHGKQILNGIVHLPLVMPPVVTGYLLLLLLGNQGLLGRWLNDFLGISVAFRWTGAAIASAVMGFPLMVRAIRLSIESIDLKLESAASTLGANRLWVYLTITLPLSIPGILAGVILGFAKGLGEFGATITFVSNIAGETRTLPSAIYSFLQIPGGESSAIRLTIIAIAISMIALLTSEYLAVKAQQRLHGHDA